MSGAPTIESSGIELNARSEERRIGHVTRSQTCALPICINSGIINSPFLFICS